MCTMGTTSDQSDFHTRMHVHVCKCSDMVSIRHDHMHSDLHCAISRSFRNGVTLYREYIYYTDEREGGCTKFETLYDVHVQIRLPIFSTSARQDAVKPHCCTTKDFAFTSTCSSKTF